MDRFCYNKNRKVQQRRMNKIVRKWNRIMEEDGLWRGRFVIRQKEAYLVPFEDGSGAEFWVKLRIIDKKTGYYDDVYNFANHWAWHIGWELNDFITCEYRANAWGQLVDPRDDKTDYRSVDYSQYL